MHRYKNIAITGCKGSGKSTLARWIIARSGVLSAGFRTLRYAQTALGPLYELEEILTGERSAISALTREGIRGIPAHFDGFGAGVVASALASPAPLILLDEIGRFERTSAVFLRAVTDALNSEKKVIAVLKKEALPHILAIRQRADTLLIDLDCDGWEDGRKLAEKWLETADWF